MPGIYKNIEINPVNFAIYSRDYDITNIGPMYKYDATNKVFWANNFDTAGGLPFYREQKRGKAFFTINLNYPWPD